ncbi:MAG: hypothetical protein K0R50_2240 [Eubacterium sp.]|jgi:hypothetical protein|nr:hypothetical protein [Eubacterium sp.]
MRHLENAFKFTFKNFLLTLPLLISLAIPALVQGVGNVGVMANSNKIFSNLQRMIEDLQYGGGNFNYFDMFAGIDMRAAYASSAIAGVLSLIFMIIVRPATYGLINLNYETGNAKLNDFSRSMSKYIGRYVLYGLLHIAIAIGITIVFVILMVIAGIVAATISVPFGVLLIILFILATIVGSVALYTYMNLWFPAICVEDSDIMQGLKNSFRFVKGSFWPIFGITLLVTVCGSIAGSILGGIIGLIPIVGNIVAPIITGLAQFILMVYYFEIYREKTGRYTIPEPPQQFNGGYPNGGIQ